MNNVRIDWNGKMQSGGQILSQKDYEMVFDLNLR